MDTQQHKNEDRHRFSTKKLELRFQAHSSQVFLFSRLISLSAVLITYFVGLNLNKTERRLKMRT